MRSDFIEDVARIRRRALEHIQQGITVPGFEDDVEIVTKLLNEALAAEIICLLRYKRHYAVATGLGSRFAAAELLQHAMEEAGYADQIAARIAQLGGAPDYNPAVLSERDRRKQVEVSSMLEMMREDLVAERIGIDSFGAMIRYLADRDPTTRRLLERILANEQDHAKDMADLLFDMEAGSAGRESSARHASNK